MKVSVQDINKVYDYLSALPGASLVNGKLFIRVLDGHLLGMLSYDSKEGGIVIHKSSCSGHETINLHFPGSDGDFVIHFSGDDAILSGLTILAIILGENVHKMITSIMTTKEARAELKEVGDLPTAEELFSFLDARGETFSRLLAQPMIVRVPADEFLTVVFHGVVHFYMKDGFLDLVLQETTLRQEGLRYPSPLTSPIGHLHDLKTIAKALDIKGSRSEAVRSLLSEIKSHSDKVAAPGEDPVVDNSSLKEKIRRSLESLPQVNEGEVSVIKLSCSSCVVIVKSDLLAAQSETDWYTLLRRRLEDDLSRYELALVDSIYVRLTQECEAIACSQNTETPT